MDPQGPAVSIVLPTFNESEALPAIVPRIHTTLDAAGIAHEILVVDDASPDGTADVAVGLAERYPVRVIRRTEDRGLAKAVLAGFEAAEAPLCVVMDADGSHPVEALPSMVEMLQGDKADIVVGSRHVHGGGSRNWPVFSQLKSKLAASVTLGLTAMTDPTTGFMAVRKNLLEGLDLDPVGWKIVLEVVVKAAPARLAEVPIVFADREHGQSKQSLSVAWEYAEHLAKLYAYRFPALAELLRFCLVGIVGLVIDVLTVVVAKEIGGLDTRLCAALGFGVAVTSNFVFNRYWTFPRARDLPLLWSYLTYVGTNLLGLSVRVFTIHLLIVMAGLDQGYDYVWTNLIGIALATIFNFVGAKYFAFDPDRLSFGEAATPDVDDRESGTPVPGRAIVLVTILSLLLSLAFAVSFKELSTHDEGVNATMARNMLQSDELVLRPSVYPGGHTDWVRDDLPALGNTPFYPGLLALATGLVGPTGMALLSWLSQLVLLIFSYRLMALFDRRAALVATLLIAASPSLSRQLALIEFEPVLTALCMAGLFYFARGTRERRRGSSALGGALMGLGFLTKMWLITPFVFAACALTLVEATLARTPGERRFRLRGSVLATTAGFGLTAGAHLALVALARPEDLGHWISSVYLGIFSGSGVTGDKLSAIGRYAGSPRPLWYYPAVLYRDHFYLVPLALFGMPALVRRARPRAVAVLSMGVGALLSLVVLSVPAVKEPLYVLGVAPFAYLLTGAAISELLGDSQVYRGVNDAGIRVAVSIALVSAVAMAASALGSEGDTSAVRYALAHGVGMLLVGMIAFAELRGRRLTTALVTAAALVVAGNGASRLVSTEPSPLPEVAKVLQAPLENVPPAAPSFQASEHTVLQSYLMRRGSPLDVDAPDRAAIRAWVFSPRDLRDPRLRRLAEVLAGEHHATALASGYRVITRAP